MLAGQVIVGGVVSFTVIVCAQEELPALFVAVHVIVVVPTGYGSLNARSSLRCEVTVTPLPVVVGCPGSTVASQLLSAVAVLLGGQVIVGTSGLSVTVIVKVQLPPPVSEVDVTVVVPTGKNEPEAGVEEIGPQLPVATGSG